MILCFFWKNIIVWNNLNLYRIGIIEQYDDRSIYLLLPSESGKLKKTSIHSFEEYEVAVNLAIEYYKKEYPQHRFKGKTCLQVKMEALDTKDPVQYPLTKNYQCIKYKHDDRK